MDNWQTIKPKKVSHNNNNNKICVKHSKFGKCDCFNVNNKNHPFVCDNFLKGKCTFTNCRLLHPTEIKPIIKSYYTNSKYCNMYMNWGYCKCLDKNDKNKSQHPKLCKNKECNDYNCNYKHIKKKKI